MGKRIAGKIKWYDSEHGFGAIAGSDGRNYLFVAQSLTDVDDIEVGTPVIFEAIPRSYNEGGFRAINVELESSPVPEPPKAKSVRLAPPSPSSAPVDSQAEHWFQIYSKATINQPSNKTPIETKVVGVTFEGRQSIVAILSIGEEVKLIREPDNPFDQNAIKVVRNTGECFGFISGSLAASLSSRFDKYGKPVVAFVTSKTGGYYSDSKVGVTIRFDLPEI